MAGCRLVIRSQPAEAIRHLPPQIKRGVRSALRMLRANPAIGEPLQGELEGLRKYRVHRFRLVYRLDRGKRTVDLLAVGQRRTIYEEVAELLRAPK
jgi:mRNA interferase RelE/StbE